MKNIFSLTLLVFMLFYSSANAQFNAPMEKVTLVFKDGREVTGLARLASKNRLKFRAKKGEKATKYDFDEILYYITYKGGELRKYVELNVERRTKPIIAMEYVKGDASLYLKSYTGYNSGFGPGGTGGIHGNFSYGSYSYSKTQYYLKLNNYDKAIDFATNGLFIKDFKKAITLYFKDCPSLIQKVSEEDYKLKDILSIVEYYNNNCSEL